MARPVGHPAYNKGRQERADWLRERLTYSETECLLWPFAKNWNGYGNLLFGEKITYAHRVMCQLVHGPAPTPNLVAAHSCNNGHLGCVHPKHISWETPRQNLLDRRGAGTLTKKRWHNKGLLSDDQIAKIVALKGHKNQREIAAMFGISYQHVSVIQNGKLKRQQRAA